MVNQAAAHKTPLKIDRQRLSDWFGGKAVPSDPTVVTFLVSYLQSKADRTSGYQKRSLDWWSTRRREAEQQRQASRDALGNAAVQPRPRRRLPYATERRKGARGPLTRIRHRPGDPPAASGQPCYRLADYLEQLGRSERAGVYSPDSLWTSFTTTVSDPQLFRRLGEQAERRGRYQHAIWLFRQAADRGDNNVLLKLALLREHAGDPAGAEARLLQAIYQGNTAALLFLARRREEAGDSAGAETLCQPAADRGDTTALQELARLRLRAGDTAGAEALALLAADCGDTTTLQELATGWGNCWR